MKARLCPLLGLFLLFPSSTNAQQIRWYSFDKDFIINQYGTSAIGELPVKTF
jgi:hypothetical protein